MKVNGSDCSIVIKTAYREMDVPYSEETIREAVSLLQEEASIEGDGISRAIRKVNGVTGCVVTPLTIGTAPLLFYLAMGSAGLPVFASETRELYRYQLNLLPLEDTDCFDLIQDRKPMSNEQGTGNNEQRINNNQRRLYEGCRVKEFELRINRDEAIKLKLEICGERTPVTYPYNDIFIREAGELFRGENVRYKITGKEYTNIYGLTLATKKDGGTRTELWIKRVLDTGYDLPQIIDEMTITAQLLHEKYEHRHFGLFRITVKRLVMTSNETNVNSSDAVIGPLRYYVAGTVATEVFTSGEEVIA
jgi:hypothetical protein